MTEREDPKPGPVERHRISFREANLGVEKPLEPPASSPGFLARRKRSVSVGLLAAGASAFGLYSLLHKDPDCEKLPPEQVANCQSHSGGGGHGGGGGGFHFASRGGFGGTGAAHAGSGG